MLEKLLERLKNQELTQTQELELREEISQLDKQIESNIQSRRTDAIVKIREDKKKSKELNDIKSKLHNVCQSERKRSIMSTLIAVPLATLFLGGLFGSLVIADIFSLGVIGAMISIVVTVALMGGITASFAYMDKKNHEQNQKEEKELLARYEQSIDFSLEKVESEQIDVKKSYDAHIDSRERKSEDRDVESSKELIEESNIESF